MALNYKVLEGVVEKGDRVLAGVSGGADSMCLLDLLYRHKQNTCFELVVVHVNHNIRGEEALRDQLFVEEECKKRGINFVLKTINTIEYANKNSKTIEQAARELRYSAFNEVVKEFNINKIMLAHHKDDQAETVLMHIARGSSIKGARGILRNVKNLYRPLLDFYREEIISYNELNNISFIQDSTNNDVKYTRNYIRNIVIPALKNVYPNIVGSLCAFAQKCAYDEEFIDKLLPKELIKKEGDLVKIPVECLKTEYALASRIIKCAVELMGVYVDFEERHIGLVLELVNKQNGKKLNLTNNIIAVKEYENIVLQLVKERKTQNAQNFGLGVFNFNEECEILVEKHALCGELVFEPNKHFIDIDKLPKTAQFRLAQEGDIFKKYGSGTKKLSDYFIDKKAPKRKRSNTIVLANENKVYCVVGMEISEDVKIDKNTKNIAVITIKKSYF